MAEPISSIRNLGSAYEKSLAGVGITSADQLRDVGPDAAYGKLLANGTRPHFIGYYVLVMGLQGRPWDDCKGEEKKKLRVRFDALKAKHFDNDLNAFETVLDSIGVGTRR